MPFEPFLRGMEVVFRLLNFLCPEMFLCESTTCLLRDFRTSKHHPMLGSNSLRTSRFVGMHFLVFQTRSLCGCKSKYEREHHGIESECASKSFVKKGRKGHFKDLDKMVLKNWAGTQNRNHRQTPNGWLWYHFGSRQHHALRGPDKGQRWGAGQDRTDGDRVQWYTDEAHCLRRVRQSQQARYRKAKVNALMANGHRRLGDNHAASSGSPMVATLATTARSIALDVNQVVALSTVPPMTRSRHGVHSQAHGTSKEWAHLAGWSVWGIKITW